MGDVQPAKNGAGAGEVSRRDIVMALAGNPNAGKTTIFNLLAGTRHRVGNYAGVTVEKVEGEFRHQGSRIRVVDLPGTYSLTAFSEDELVARNYVLDSHPDLVVDVVDASNLERNLYLAVQLMELRVPLVLVFNKADLARQRGLCVDLEKLSRLMGVRIVETVGADGTGIEGLKDAILETALGSPQAPATVRYGRELEAEIKTLIPLLEGVALSRRGDARWNAVKLLEGDADIRARLERCCREAPAVLAAADAAAERIRRHFGDRAAIIVADRRYGFISGACTETVQTTVEVRHSISDRIDDIVTSPLLGIPIFLLLMYVLFLLTFSLAAPPMAWIEAFFGWLGRWVGGWWPAGSESALRSLLVDGILGGVGGVLVFIPNIAILFAAIAFLEDSGYMARGAFIVDRFMHKIGLHGRSFIPAMVGFGCTVPAIMAARSLESRRDRMTTIMVLPLISCGARFPIYSLFIAAFFPPEWRARMLMIIYLTGIALAAVLARLLRNTLFSGESSQFVMELPPYRMPPAGAILRHTWERTRMFLRKAGTLIVVASAILWALTNYPKPAPERVAGLAHKERRAVELGASVAGRVGHALEPVMSRVGFDWRTTTALIGAFAAKEIFVAQLGIIHSAGEDDTETLQARLRAEYTRLQAFCIMLFCLISLPCVATFIVTRTETGAWRWAILQVAGLTLLAYAVTFVVYQAGLLVGFG